MFTPPEYRHLNSWGDTCFLIELAVVGAILVGLFLCLTWGN